MKKFKIFAFSILGAALVTIGLYSCSNEETLNSNQDDSEQIANLQSRSDGDALIAHIDGANLVPQIDLYEFESELISSLIFEEIESIEIVSDLNPETNEYESYLNIIGKNPVNYSLTAFQTELIKDGNYLYFPDPETPELPITTFATHECDGNGCSSCSFVYEIKSNGKKGKITGCDCNDTGSCDHKVTDKDQADKNKDTAKTVLEILKAIF
ncbi:hypothetical protein [Paenimyroides viscosum]|uniref:Lipoprotein n=1 Tax=Paenimyroides viscosum TaxID=2488729 RepID=A0A3P1B2M4_9FLAO|nr:hypothetical protein [Paenimyroides viscosum]RRA95410.1 hypothetical protein EG242_06020 [Paenimyroides viscosum]